MEKYERKLQIIMFEMQNILEMPAIYCHKLAWLEPTHLKSLLIESNIVHFIWFTAIWSIDHIEH